MNPLPAQPKVSLITVVWNNVETIGEAVQSVLSQDYPHLEYIVIDGASSDGTLDVLEAFRPRLSALVSEPDKGIYDAMNKGLALATGDIVGLLNSDDFYAHTKVISRVVALMQATQAETLYADLQYVDRDLPGRVVRDWRSGPYKRAAFRYGWMPPHPTFFVRRELYQNYGPFDTSFRSAADYELMLRFLYRHEASACYLPETTVKMRVGGKSNQSLSARLNANAEDARAWKVNGLSRPFYTTWLKPLRKLPQFILHKLKRNSSRS